MDTINRANAQFVSVEEQVLREVTLQRYLSQEALVFQKQVADAMTKSADNGITTRPVSGP
jgi:hypothetical protein